MAAATGLLLLVFAASTRAESESPERPPAEAWPPVSFSTGIVHALNQRDTWSWEATGYDESTHPPKARVAAAIRRELAARYPSAWLRRELDAVFVVGSLSAEGRRWGGTYWAGSLILTAGPEEYLLDALHHEMAGLILSRGRRAFSWERWGECAPAARRGGDDVSYLPSVDGTGAEGAEPSPEEWLRPTDELAARGFVSRYGTTTAENDVEEHLRLLFRSPEVYLPLAERHEPLRCKLRLVLALLAGASGGELSGEHLRGWTEAEHPDLPAAAPQAWALLADAP